MMKLQEYYNKLEEHRYDDDIREKLLKEYEGEPEYNTQEGYLYYKHSKYKVFFNLDDIYEYLSENKNIDLSYIYYDDYDSYVKDHYTDEDFKYKIRDFDFDHDLYRDEFEEYKKSEILNLYGKYKEEIDLYFTDFYYYKKHLEKILNEEKKGAL